MKQCSTCGRLNDPSAKRCYRCEAEFGADIPVKSVCLRFVLFALGIVLLAVILFIL